MVTDAQVGVLRRKRMAGKTQEAAAASAGMSVRSARKWEHGLFRYSDASRVHREPGRIRWLPLPPSTASSITLLSWSSTCPASAHASGGKTMPVKPRESQDGPNDRAGSDGDPHAGPHQNPSCGEGAESRTEGTTNRRQPAKIILAERTADVERSNLNSRFHVRSSEGL